MGRDGMFPKMLSRVHPKYHSPYVGVIVIGASSTFLCLAFTDKAQVMTSMVNFSMLLCWSLINLTTMYFFMLKRRSRDYFRDLACPALGSLVTAWAFLSLDSAALAAGLAWLGIGALFAVYLKLVRKADLSFATDSGI
jgi:amino acid transporter